MTALQSFFFGGYDHSTCSPTADNDFGPIIGRACGRGLDFTLFFEHAILSIVPSAIFLLLAPIVLWNLRKESKKTGPNYTRALKFLQTSIFAALQIALLVLWLLEDSRDKAAIPSAVLSLCVSLSICVVSYLEHERSVRPSAIISLYSFFSLIFDVFLVRTLFLRHDSPRLVWTFVSGMAVKLIVLVQECRSKKEYLKPEFADLSPEELAGIFSSSLLMWVNPLIIKGYKSLLTIDDLPKINTRLLSEQHRDELQTVWDRRSKPESKYSLVFATISAFKWPLLAGVPYRLVMIILTYSQPFIITRSIRYVSEPSTEASRDVGTELVIAAVVVYVGVAIVTVLFRMNSSRAETVFRGGMIGLIHKTSLSLQDGHYDDSAAVTLMSTDTDMIASSTWLFYDSWCLFIELIIGISLLANQVGWACIMPLVFVLLASRVSATLGSTIAEKSKAWSQATQKRIATTSSMLGSVKSLKMMGLSDTIESKIQSERAEEIKTSLNFRWMILGFNIAGNSVTILAPVGTFAFYTIVALLQGKSSLSTSQASTSLALIGMVAAPAQHLLFVFPQAAATAGAFQRIQKYLLDSAREDKRLKTFKDDSASSDSSSYSDDESHNLNKNGNTHILDEPVHTLAISISGATVRPVKDAEPAIVNVSLQVEKGAICLVAGPVGSGKSTLAKAILGELPLDTGTIEISSSKIGYCAQNAWLLNGSIRQNICGPIDDSEVDEVWYKSVINACGLERDLSLLHDGDQSLVGSRGLVLSGGQKQRVALARTIFARTAIVLLDDVLSALDAKTERLIVERLFGSTGLLRKLGTTVVLITHSTQYFHLANHIVVIGTDKKIAEQGTFEKLRSEEGYISKLLVDEDHDDSHTAEEEHIMTTAKKAVRDPIADAAADLTRKTGDTAVYGYWVRSAGWENCLLFVTTNFLYAFFLTFPQLWLKWWTDDNSGHHLIKYMVGYILLSLGAWITNGLIIAAMSLVISPRTSKSLHHMLLHTVIRAPQNFFADTDTGVTLNRFSQDMSMVDRTLPFSFLAVSMQGFKILGQAVLLFSANRFMLTTIPFVILLVITVQKVYLQTSRQLRFMDLEEKAPVFSHFLETLEGLATIRAFGWQKRFSAESTKRLDKSQIPYYLMFCIQRWLNLTLDLLVAILAVLVIALAVSMRDVTTGGQVGIALNVILVFNRTLLYLAESYTELETSLGAVSRLKNFEEQTTSEDKPEEDHTPSEEWPQKGAVEFCGVTASYGPEAIALRNISLKIVPGQKIGVCGRTGSGKSSLLSAILRLLELDSGTIKIDGEDLQHIPREVVRTRLIAIPQDPFILTASVRDNADPSGKVPDAEIISALEKVKLWDVIEPRGGLDENMKTGLVLSQGQQQLFCLARAMLRKSKILVLDEATSSVDRKTDELMQKIIREVFKEHTIITVAHRLETIMDSDAVAVLDAGALVEFGNPRELLEKDSVFKSLHGRS